MLEASYQPTGDQPEAIRRLVEGVEKGAKDQILLGVTGSGKTFTMANIIQTLQRPALVIAHNKTLAGQLAAEFQSFFPKNRVEYFVSYYDYYQPEAYIPQTDTYIEKDLAINDEIDRMRHAATASLLERRDVIVVASVSCIYGIGNPADYRDMMLHLRVGNLQDREAVIQRLVEIQYTRNDFEIKRGCFRVRGDVLDIYPASYDSAIVRVEFFGDEIERIVELDFITQKPLAERNYAMIYPATHYQINQSKTQAALAAIEAELDQEITKFREAGQLVEAYRLEQRTRYDLEMIRETGFVKGIENYSRFFDGRAPGTAPYTLLDFFPEDYLLFIDESHATIPQIGSMLNGDKARKDSLVRFGFRLPSAYDNRPLSFPEFEAHMGQTIYVSATPGPYESQRAEQVVEQIIRPTGLLDPELEIHPVEGQIEHLIGRAREVIARGERVLVLTLTKRMAEDMTSFLAEAGLKVQYLHSELENHERLKILADLRAGTYDILCGINLLREGIDLPEVSLICILDSDMRGFLRSTTSLIQIIGRAARNANGRVILYANEVSPQMMEAISETNRRRTLQAAYNAEHHIVPKTIQKEIRTVADTFAQKKSKKAADEAALSFEEPKRRQKALKEMSPQERERLAKQVEKEMRQAAKELDFEEAARLRDWLIEIRA